MPDENKKKLTPEPTRRLYSDQQDVCPRCQGSGRG